MKSRSAFQRNFYIFVNEDSGFEAGQKPSGHVKIEVREGKGRLQTTVQNLRAGNGRFEYVLYLLCREGERTEAVRVGQLKSSFSKSELEWNFKPDNVGQSGYPVDAIDIIAVLVEYADSQQGRVICPLAAYRNKWVQWRSGLAQALMKKSIRWEIDTAENAAKNANNSIKVIENENESIVPKDSANDNWDNQIQLEVSPQIKQVGGIEQTEYPEPERIEQPQQPEQLNQPERPERPERPEQPERIEQPQQPGKLEQPEQLNQSEQPGLSNINTGCVYLNGNMCGAFVQSGSNTASPCGTCSVCRAEQTAAELPGDLSNLKAVLDNNFEKSDPFNSKRSDYIWWKVTNPVNLNNILYQNNIRSPLMFNPAVMMAHYKYRHLIIGIFTHVNGKRFVVYGVPGMHMVDRKPFGELSTWVQTQRSKPRYGSLGYWLVYINPSDGKILNISQQ